jgi:Xaa-Pro aminopeptidase
MYRSANAGRGYAGHGIGCWYSELPDINTDVADLVEPGMLLILEARLGVPNSVGATITDPVVVTSTGAERLVDLEIRTWKNSSTTVH